jgi:DNA-binding transcriptional LysR family regulator
LQQVDAKLADIARMKDRPSGLVRISAGRHSAETILLPAVTKLLAQYPDITVELSIDSHLTNIITDKYDAGVRLGEQIEKDMIAVPIGPDLRMVVVASPNYLEQYGKPASPRDLTNHRCINIRLPTKGGLYIWEFSKGGRDMNVRVEGPLILDDMPMVLAAALAGVGVAVVMEDQVSEHLKSGALVSFLDAWCSPFPGYQLYYPDRRQLSSAFRHFVESVRYRT